MDQSQLKWISDFIWNIADDRLRDVYVRGKYREVILPFTVLRRLDAVLESTKDNVLDRKKFLDQHAVIDQQGALRMAAGQAFYNTSEFTLSRLTASGPGQRLRDNFTDSLDGFSPNVQEILNKFAFRDQVQKMVEADILGHLISDFLNPEVNLSPSPVKDADGRIKLPALDNHAMGTVFEELIRRFNEDNNEEAGEHFTPRDVIQLMAKLLFLPVADQIESGTYLLYDGSCGTGGMLTVAEDELRSLAAAHGKEVSIHLFGQEINPETYAICKADLLLKGEGMEAENIVGGADKSTLSADQFPAREFDFMLSNPPYGKSWKTDLDRMGGKANFSDPRFVVSHAGDPEFKLTTRSSDGQLMFLVNKLQKMKHGTPLGSRIALVHNGSALFTGDAGQGESNIRRWVIENDWLEAIIALPLNIFYNTGIATYIWVLANRKAAHRRGKVQLIDATQWFHPLRRNLGKKNCHLDEADVARILERYLAAPPAAVAAAEAASESKWFDNADFGYWKITVERPLRLKSQLERSAIDTLRFASGDEALRREAYARWGDRLYDPTTTLRAELDAWLKGDDTDEDAEDDADGDGGVPARKSVPEKRRKKLLDAATWQRDRALLAQATLAREVLGDGVFDDHNEFRTRFDAAMKVFADEKIVVSLIRQLSWTHFIALIPLKDPLKRDFYAEMSRIERWSVRTLRAKIDSMLYERTALSRQPEVLIRAELDALRDGDRISPDLVFRDPYLLDFLNLNDSYSERDLETAILRDMEAFLLELGGGFSFVARQKHMVIDGDDHYLDLLFYHRKLRRLVAVELKLGAFKAADKGQMELYLRWLEKHEQEPGEETPLGLILCAEGGAESVALLRLDAAGIRVGQYLTALPPKELLQRRLHEVVALSRRRSRTGLAAKRRVRGDGWAYQNAVAHSDRQNAKLEHDKVLKRVVLELMADHTELFKQFSDNENFKHWLTESVFDVTYRPGQAGLPDRWSGLKSRALGIVRSRFGDAPIWSSAVEALFARIGTDRDHLNLADLAAIEVAHALSVTNISFPVLNLLSANDVGILQREFVAGDHSRGATVLSFDEVRRIALATTGRPDGSDWADRLSIRWALAEQGAAPGGGRHAQ